MGGFRRLIELVSSRPNAVARVLLVAVVGAAVGLGGGVAGAAPAGTDLASATDQAAKLQLQIAANAKRADILDERFLQARNAVTAAARRVAATEAEIAATEAKAAAIRRQLGGRAALLYIGAGSQDPLNVNVATVQDLGAMTKYGSAAAVEAERLLSIVDDTDAQLAVQHRDLQAQLAAAKDRQRAADTARRQVVQANSAEQHLLDTTNAGIKLLATQMGQQAQAAAALEEQAWLKQQAARLAAGGPLGATTDPSQIDLGPVPPPTTGALKAVAYARLQLGKPYVYAGAGPDVFDCSGLTMMAWAQAGVLMEHGSQSQYDSFPHVPIDQLQPGDLVFFGDSGPTNHHVGLVVGPGLMIDAPHTGAFVELVSYFRPDLVPLGARPSAPPGPPAPSPGP